MPNCIICKKEVDKTCGDSRLAGVYCRNCAIQRGYTDTQIINELRDVLQKQIYKPIQVANHIQDLTYCYAKLTNKTLTIDRDKFDEIIKKAKEMVENE